MFHFPAGGGAGGRGSPRGGMGRGRGRGRGGRDISLISQTVRISQGPYKGETAASFDLLPEWFVVSYNAGQKSLGRLSNY